MRIPAAAVLLLWGCAAGSSSFPLNPPLRAPDDAPDIFMFDQDTLSIDSVAVMGCRTPLNDSRTNTRLVLVRSWKGARGDYEVIPPRYGVREGELMRIDCGSGGTLGIVSR